MVLKDTDSMLHKCYLCHHSQQISSLLQQSACLCICFWYTCARTQKTTIVDRYQNMLTCIMYVCVYMEICVRIHICIVYTLIYSMMFVAICFDQYTRNGSNSPFIQFIELNRLAHGRSWPWSCFAGYRVGEWERSLWVVWHYWASFDTKKLTQSWKWQNLIRWSKHQMGWMISWYWWNFSPVFFSHKIYPYRWCSADLRRKRSKSKNKCWEPQLACWPQPSDLSDLAFKCHHFPRGIRDLKTQPWISLSSLAQGA